MSGRDLSGAASLNGICLVLGARNFFHLASSLVSCPVICHLPLPSKLNVSSRQEKGKRKQETGRYRISFVYRSVGGIDLGQSPL